MTLKNKKILVVDLEATCDLDNKNIEMETIEIGAVVVDEDFNEIAYFERFCKPLLNPKLTDFCKQLTTITQEQVDLAHPFASVWAELMEFCTENGVSEWASWGNYDKKQFEKDLARTSIVPPVWFEEHTNFKVAFIKTRPGKNKAVGVKKACEMMNVEQTLPHHRALSDAKSVVSIMRKAKESKK